MIVQMDKMSAPSSRELAQRLYDKNVELENKRRKSAQARIPSDPNAWQQMRENYEAIILEDHAFSEQHNIEYALWQLHYRRIEEFRAHFSAALASMSSTTSQNAKGQARPDRITRIRLQFKTFLSEATGFYHDLILKIRAKYGLPLGYFSEDSGNQMVMEKDGKKSAEMKNLISCHRSLIYLGDLARYKGLYGDGDSKTRDYAAASSYYLQAASLWPSSGNPHHQLAILASYSGDELVSVYRYFRSLAVDSPFSTARENLIVAFEKNRQNYAQMHVDAKASAPREPRGRINAKGREKEEAKLQSKDNNLEVGARGTASNSHDTYKAFCIRFVRLNGILFTRTSLETFAEVLASVSSALHELLSSGPEEELNFGGDALENGLVIVRLISILIFTVHNVNRQAEGQTYAEILQRNVLLQNACAAVFEFMGHISKRCAQLNDALSSYLLPGILVFVEWLACCPDVAAGSDVDEKQAAVRSVFWNHFISLLNKLVSNGMVSMDNDEDETCFFNMSRYEEGETENRLALWEDFELRGFLPILPAQMILDFSRKHSLASDGNKEKKARVRRVLAAGKALANIVRVGQKTIYFDPGVKKFIIGIEPQKSDDFAVGPYLGMHKSNGVIEEIPAEKTINPGALQSKTQLYVEGEEEDEVIVFKPTVAEKQTDVIDQNWLAYNGPETHKTASASDLHQFYGGSIPGPLSDLHQHAALGSGVQPPVPVANSSNQHLPSVQSRASTWMAEHEDTLYNGLKCLSVSENMHARKPELQEDIGISHPASFSVPIQHPLNFNASGISYGQIGLTEAGIPFKVESAASSGVKADSFIVNTSSALQPSSRRSPVSRPVRHFGPPPGFSPVPPKLVNEPLSGLDLTSESPLFDDYSWLDGYQLPSAMKNAGLNNSNQVSDANPQFASKSSGMSGTVSFPFPGKQISTMQFQPEKQKGWQDYKPLEYLKLHHEQQLQEPQLTKGNQQFTPLSEQYQGLPMWTGQYFV
ncbi:nonsense-mediated mRNA decay factor SMG7 [Malania oleifera]|uniref:nonsense-mediated mRNA decay factor SMG7 n=1 Tax=Malania oleifera TaxID=397392 RepID=UPI0025AE69B4|nr:nonsense-mediated mRNA decay factor SMG7 [Malania oleifera]